MWKGIRFRVTALAVFAVAVLLVAMAAALLSAQRRLLTEDLDEALTTYVEELSGAIAEGDVSRAVPLPRRGDDDAVAQVTTRGGLVMAATPNDAEVAMPPLPDDTVRGTRTMQLKPGEPPFRVLSERVGAQVIHVASPMDDIGDSGAALRFALSGAIPAATLVLGALVWWLVGRTLRPVDAIRREVESISAHSLHRRVPESSAGDETENAAN